MSAIPYSSLPGVLAPTGSCDYPLRGDVEAGVIYSGGLLTGTLELPLATDVRAGVGYGEDGTEFFGAYAAIAGMLGANITNPNDVDVDLVTIGDITAEIIEVV